MTSSTKSGCWSWRVRDVDATCAARAGPRIGAARSSPGGTPRSSTQRPDLEDRRPISSASGMNSTGQIVPRDRVPPSARAPRRRRSCRRRSRRSAGSGGRTRRRSTARCERRGQLVARGDGDARMCGSKTDDAALAARLGRVHRDVRVAQQVVGGLRVRAARRRRRCWPGRGRSRRRSTYARVERGDQPVGDVERRRQVRSVRRRGSRTRRRRGGRRGRPAAGCRGSARRPRPAARRRPRGRGCR